jgi:hypothetical protein
MTARTCAADYSTVGLMERNTCLGSTPTLVALRPARSGTNDTNLIDGLSLLSDGKIFGFDFESQAIVGAHVDIGDPDQREFRDDKPAPSSIKHLELGQEQEKRGHVVASAVLAREQVEEFPLIEALAVLTLVFTKFAELPEDFFMGDRP